MKAVQIGVLSEDLALGQLTGKTEFVLGDTHSRISPSRTDASSRIASVLLSRYRRRACLYPLSRIALVGVR